VSAIELIGRHAKELVNMPDGHVAKWEALHSEGFAGHRISVVEAPLVKVGKNAGRPNWAKRTDERSVYILDTDHTAWLDAWSALTGLCKECGGKATTFKRWSVVDGLETVPCEPCKGTGNANCTPTPVLAPIADHSTLFGQP
jgi:hypothetical protein